MHRPTCVCFVCKKKLSKSDVSRLARIHWSREHDRHIKDLSSIEPGGKKNSNSFIIEGTLRLQDNLISCKNRYGYVFLVDVVKMDGDIYFSKISTLRGIVNVFKGDKDTVYALVSQDDDRLILGKFRYEYEFSTCKIQLKENNCALSSDKDGHHELALNFETYPNDKTKNTITTGSIGLFSVNVL